MTPMYRHAMHTIAASSTILFKYSDTELFVQRIFVSYLHYVSFSTVCYKPIPQWIVARNNRLQKKVFVKHEIPERSRHPP
jgi:hypothetical protein